MNLDNLKSALRKERHAELMIATGGAILIATVTSILDPETLKLLATPEPTPVFPISVKVWSIFMIAGTYLVIRGLNRIDAERAANRAQNSPGLQTASPPTIEIKHGNTQISIHIQPEKNHA